MGDAGRKRLTPPPVGGILESALYVEDIDRSVDFYQRLFGFDVLTRGRRICVLNVAGSNVLLIFQRGSSTSPTRTPGGVIPPTDGAGELHMAFRIDAESLDEWRQWLAENGVETESEVKWERGGISLYFRDPDRHTIELVTPGTWAIY